MNKRLTAALTGICTALIMLTGAHAADAAKGTVTISGKAYIFGHMDTPISNAQIKVREFPKISATTDEIGDFKLKVPNDSNVTPYIPSGSGPLTRRNLDDYSPKGPPVETHWNEIDLQTFHTRGANLVNANFQTPADGEYAGLKAILKVQARADGRPAKCAIVTTASVRSVRGVDYRTFESETARLHGHGVPGGTSIEYPALDGPIYFNKNVIPDPSETQTSQDGGIVWTEVPAGTYRIVTTSPTTRFASFLATCKPGRVVNANPPWGAYQLNPGERPQGAGKVAASVRDPQFRRAGKTGRQVGFRVVAGERVAVRSRALRGGVTLGVKLARVINKTRTIWIPIPRRVAAGRVRLQVRLVDEAFGKVTTSRYTRLGRSSARTRPHR